MSEKSLNYLILVFLLITIGGYFVINSNQISNETTRKWIVYIYMFVFGTTPLLLMMKVISRIFLTGLKDQRVSFLENLFTLYYFLLTKEARKEWADYIEEQKRKSI